MFEAYYGLCLTTGTLFYVLAYLFTLSVLCLLFLSLFAIGCLLAPLASFSASGAHILGPHEVAESVD